MSNWCANDLTIVGSQQEIKEVMDAVKSSEEKFSIDAFFPMPEELEGQAPFRGPDEERERLTGLYGAADWYAWRLSRWGVKWDVSDAEITRNEVNISDQTGVLCYYFNTPWGPPEKAIRKLSEIYPGPSFILAYDEPGMDFGGYCIYQGGEVLEVDEGGSRMASWSEIAVDSYEDCMYQLSKEKEEVAQ